MVALRLGLRGRVFWQREAAALPRRYRLQTENILYITDRAALLRLEIISAVVAAHTRSSKVKSGVEHRVSSLDSSRWESLEQGVWGLEVVSGLAGLMGDGTWL